MILTLLKSMIFWLRRLRCSASWSADRDRNWPWMSCVCRSVDVRWLSQTDGGSLPCSDLIIAVGPNATGEKRHASAVDPAEPVFEDLSCFPRLHLRVCVELRRLAGRRLGFPVERAEPWIRPDRHGSGPWRAVLRPVPAEAGEEPPSVRFFFWDILINILTIRAL